MTTAYLLALFETKSGTPVFVGVRIYSERYPTERLSVLQVPLCEAQGVDYEHANAKLRRVLYTSPHLAWAVKHLEKIA